MEKQGEKVTLARPLTTTAVIDYQFPLPFARHRQLLAALYARGVFPWPLSGWLGWSACCLYPPLHIPFVRDIISAFFSIGFLPSLDEDSLCFHDKSLHHRCSP